MVSRRGRAARVDIYLGPRAFYRKDMEKKERAGQFGDLPPRCAHCRVSWDTAVVDGVVHCAEHYKSCDGTCGIEGDVVSTMSRVTQEEVLGVSCPVCNQPPGMWCVRVQDRIDYIPDNRYPRRKQKITTAHVGEPTELLHSQRFTAAWHLRVVQHWRRQRAHLRWWLTTYGDILKERDVHDDDNK